MIANSAPFCKRFRFAVLVASLESVEYQESVTKPIVANTARIVITTMSSARVKPEFRTFPYVFMNYGGYRSPIALACWDISFDSSAREYIFVSSIVPMKSRVRFVPGNHPRITSFAVELVGLSKRRIAPGIEYSYARVPFTYVLRPPFAYVTDNR